MATLSTHVLDGADGGSKVGVDVEVRHLDGTLTGVSTTDERGRAEIAAELPSGRYRVIWHLTGFIAELSAVVSIEGDRHYHVPVLASGSSAVVYLGV